jgi:phosphoribosylglycinamide formyltransferase 1
MEGRIAVLASGEGTNLQAILDDSVLRPLVVMVMSDRRAAGALRRAEHAGVRAEFLDPAAQPDRRAFDRALLDLLAVERIDVLALAGYMRILGAGVVAAFPGRILNVHPALLPSFPGATAVADALAWGAKVTGVTVHVVDEEVDHGPIVFQEAIPVVDDDDLDSLEARVHEVEHRLLPAALKALLEGRIRIEGRRAVVGDGP